MNPYKNRLLSEITGVKFTFPHSVTKKGMEGIFELENSFATTKTKKFGNAFTKLKYLISCYKVIFNVPSILQLFSLNWNFMPIMPIFHINFFFY